MEKTTLYLGLNDQATKHQEIATTEAYKIVTNLITAYAGGGTIYECTGVYTYDDGTIITEKSFKIELFGGEAKKIIQLAGVLKNALNQESIIMQRDVITSEIL